MRRLASFAVVLALSLGVVPRASAEEDGFRPRLGEARLSTGAETVAPVRVVVGPGAVGERVGRRWIVADGATLRAHEGEAGGAAWEARLPVGRRPEMVAVGPDHVLLRAWKLAWREEPGEVAHETWEPDDAWGLRPLRVRDGAVLEPLAGADPRSVRWATADAGGFLLLADDTPDTFRLLSYAPGETTPAWERTLLSGGAVERPTPSRHDEAWIPAGPRRFHSGRARLPTGLRDAVAAGDRVVLRLPGSGDLVGVDRASGEEEWRVARVWEFERHYPGEPIAHLSFVREGDAARRATLARTCSLAAGPFAVPLAEAWHVFVVVLCESPEADAESAGPLPTWRLYEIDGHGRPQAVVHLPRGPAEGGHVEVAGGLWLNLGEEGIARVEPTEQREMGDGWRGAGGTDLLGRLARWHEYAPVRTPPSWRVVGASPPLLAVDGGTAWQAVGHPWVASSEDRVLHVPLRRIDLATGAATPQDLRVPFDGAFPPSSHAAGREADAAASLFTTEDLGLWIESLEAEGGEVRVGLAGAGDLHARLDFPSTAAPR